MAIYIGHCCLCVRKEKNEIYQHILKLFFFFVETRVCENTERIFFNIPNCVLKNIPQWLFNYSHRALSATSVKIKIEQNRKRNLRRNSVNEKEKKKKKISNNYISVYTSNGILLFIFRSQKFFWEYLFFLFFCVHEHFAVCVIK